VAADATGLTASTLVFVSLGAFAIPIVCRPLRVPAAVGEIVYGILMGPIFQLVTTHRFLSSLAELGVLLLMFMAGLEIDFRRLEEAGPKLLFRSTVRAITVFAVALSASAWLGWPPFLGLVLGLMSIGVLISVLQENRLMRTTHGQDWLLIGSVGEFISILIATSVNAYHLAGGLNHDFSLQFLKLGLLFLGAYTVLVSLRMAVWWKAETFARVVETHDPSEVGVRAGMALMFVFVAATEAFHIEPILGSFMAGALFGFVFRDRGALELKFLSLGNGFFVPVFFISVGLNFDVRSALSSDLGLFLKMLGVMLLARLCAMALYPPRNRLSLSGAFLLTCPLTLMVVFADLGVRLQLIDTSFRSTLVLLAVSTSLIFPAAAKLVLSRATLPNRPSLRQKSSQS
jgi:Kef-type K+ transport system membrane component KefB